MGGSPYKKIGLRIRRLRRSQKMSQQALAAAVGVHANTVARWECNGIDSQHRAMPSIAAALQCPTELIIGEAAAADAAQPSPSEVSDREAYAAFLAAVRSQLHESSRGP